MTQLSGVVGMSVSTEQLSAASITKSVRFSRRVGLVLGACIIALSDFLVVCLALVLAFWTRAYIMPYFFTMQNVAHINSLWNLWWLPPLCILLLAYKGFYRRRFPYWHEVRMMINTITLTFTVAIIFLFLLKSADAVSRPIIVLTYLFCLFLLPAGRYFIKSRLTSVGLWTKPVLILGAGKTAELVIKGFRREKTMGYHPLGMLEDDINKNGISSGKEVIPILGRFSNIEEVLARTGVKDIVVAVPGMKNGKLAELTNRLQRISANILLVPDLFEIPLAGVKIDFLFDEKVLLMSMPNNLASMWNRLMKRAFDLVVGSISLIFAMPLMVLIAIAIRLDSKGPAIFTQPRIGRNEESYLCYKFRTMYQDNEKIMADYLKRNPIALSQWKKYAKLKDYDPRVTRVGRILRRLSLDELPQIINIFKGQMSLVGPRPYLYREREDMGEYAETILRTQPGITGLWQVSGRNELSFNDRLYIDKWYVCNWSLWLDMTVLVRTIGVVLNRNGAY